MRIGKNVPESDPTDSGIRGIPGLVCRFGVSIRQMSMVLYSFEPIGFMPWDWQPTERSESQ